MASSSAIEVRSLTKFYNGNPAVVDASFKVEKGEVVGFLGPNGAGKTTTLNAITGVLVPDSGDIYIDGMDTLEHPMHVRKLLGYLPEVVPLYPEMTVEEYLAYAAKLRDVPAGDLRRSIDRVVSDCGLSDVRKRLIKNLSKGFGQRVGIAQAIIHEPPILILDEPTIGLDPLQIQEIRGLIRGLAGDHTILLSTHILPEVTMICSKVIIINEGRIVAEDTLDGLLRMAKEEPDYYLSFASEEDEKLAGEFLEKAEFVSHVEHKGKGVIVTLEDSSEAVDSLVRGSVEKGIRVREIKPLVASLEDIFVKLTTEEAGREEG